MLRILHRCRCFVSVSGVRRGKRFDPPGFGVGGRQTSMRVLICSLSLSLSPIMSNCLVFNLVILSRPRMLLSYICAYYDWMVIWEIVFLDMSTTGRPDFPPISCRKEGGM